jgi:hypothetical protein
MNIFLPLPFNKFLSSKEQNLNPASTDDPLMFKYQALSTSNAPSSLALKALNPLKQEL